MPDENPTSDVVAEVNAIERDVLYLLTGMTCRSGPSGTSAVQSNAASSSRHAAWMAALDNLRDRVEQYLEFLRDDKPKLAPDIAHHAEYIALLDTPRDLWFASVEIDAPAVE